MFKRSIQKIQVGSTEPDEVFELAAEVFRVTSAPMRLRIISSLCSTVCTQIGMEADGVAGQMGSWPMRQCLQVSIPCNRSVAQS